MSCPNYDWKGYALGELDKNARAAAEAHARTCESCREDLAATRLTLDALSTLREEEVPRRIAFVSDKVFETRWWQRIWNPTFAAACVVAAAILVHGFISFAHPATDSAAVQAQVDRAVAKAVADTQQHEAQIEEVLLTLQKQNNQLYRQTAF